MTASPSPTSSPSPDPTASAGTSSAIVMPAPRLPATAGGAAAASPAPVRVSPNGVPIASNGLFPGGLLIADRANGRLLIVNQAKRIVWSFPGPGSLPAGQGFSADDAFLSPDGRTIVANEEMHQVVVRIDIATRRVVWEYGHWNWAGSAPGYLHTPDDAYPLRNGDVVVADIRNCRVIEIAPDKRIVRIWGRTGVCVNQPPVAYASPNGDTPLPDGGLLITEIGGSRVIRLSASGRVIFNVHVPASYPSDAQLDVHGNVVLADYANPGAVLSVSPTGRLLWRYAPPGGPGWLNHPSLAMPLRDGTVVVTDDFRQRVILLDPRTGHILWQYGLTGQAGRSGGRLWIPDGLDPVPVGTVPGL